MGQDTASAHGGCYNDCYYYKTYQRFCKSSQYDDCGASYYSYNNYYTRVYNYYYVECPSPGDCGLTHGAVIALYVGVMIFLCCCVTIILKKAKRNEARQTAARNLAAAERERARLEEMPVDAEILTDEKLTLMADVPIRYSEVEAGMPAEQRPS